MIKLIVFDLDNVLIDGEAIDEFGKLVGVEDKIMEITKKAMDGKLNFESSLKERVKLLKGARLDDIKNVVESIPLMEGAEETIKELKKREYKVATITGSFEIIANRIKDKLSLDYAFSNVLHEEDGFLTGEVSGPLVDGSKAEVLKQILKMENISTKECVAVGDGANDISMLEEAGLGIAFNAKPVLKEIADVVVENRDLRKLLTLFNDIEKNTKESKKESKKKESKYLEPSKLEENYIELLDAKKEYEKKLSLLTEERDKLNQNSKHYKQLRDDFNSSLKENLDKAIEYRNERDKINEKVKKYKKMRDQANEDFKKMEWNSRSKDITNIEREIKKLEKEIETKVLDIKKENELVNKVTELLKNLQMMQEDEKIRNEAYELKKYSESYHAKVVELSESAQTIHEKMLESFQRIDDIRGKADDVHKKFIEFKEKASKKHEEVKEILNDLRKINKNLDKIRVKRRGLDNETAMREKVREKELAEDIYQKFKDGKKLTTDELLLLQRHDVV